MPVPERPGRKDLDAPVMVKCTTVGLARNTRTNKEIRPLLSKDGRVLCDPPSAVTNSGSMRVLILSLAGEGYPSSKVTSCRELRSSYCFTAFSVALAIFVPIALLFWRMGKRRELLLKNDTEIEEYADVAQMPVLLKTPADPHLSKSM